MSDDKPAEVEVILMDPELRKFLDGIDEFNANHSLEGEPLGDDYQIAERLTYAELDGLTQDDLFTNADLLYQYASYINDKRARLQNIIYWCSGAINRVVGREYENVSKFAPHEVKEAQVANEHEFVRKIMQWKLTCQARIEALSDKTYILKRRADAMIERAKRK